MDWFIQMATISASMFCIGFITGSRGFARDR